MLHEGSFPYIYQNIEYQVPSTTLQQFQVTDLVINMFVAVFLTLCLAHGAVGKLIIGEPGNGNAIPINAMANDHAILTVVGQQAEPEWWFKSSVNLYDFNKNVEARLVVDEKTCYVRNFTGTWEEAQKMLSGGEGTKAKVTEEWNIPGEEIPAEKLEETVGEKVTEMCEGYKVYWSSEQKKAKRQWNAHVNGGYNQRTGASVSGGVGYRRGNFGANLSGSWSQRGGVSASAGLSWTFGK